MQVALARQKMESQRKKRILNNPKYIISIDKEGLDEQVKFKRDKFEKEERLEKLYEDMLISTENKLMELQASKEELNRLKTVEYKGYKNEKPKITEKQSELGVSAGQISDDPKFIETQKRKKKELSKWLDNVSNERRLLDTQFKDWINQKEFEALENDKRACGLETDKKLQKKKVSNDTATFNFTLASDTRAKILKQRQESISEKLDEINYLVNSPWLNEKKSASLNPRSHGMQQDNFKGVDTASKLNNANALKLQVQEKCREQEMEKTASNLYDLKCQADLQAKDNLINQVQRQKFREIRNIQNFNLQQKPLVQKPFEESNFFDRSFGKSSR